jgi:PAS domain S-box-containing protein
MARAKPSKRKTAVAPAGPHESGGRGRGRRTSAYDELSAANAALQSKIAALEATNNDLANLLASAGIVTTQRTAELEAEIKERRQAEETLRAERNFVSAILGTAAALVIVLDREGRVVRFNKACEDVSGYASEELQGKTIWDALLVLEEADGVKRVFAELQKGAFPNRYENYWRHKDGSRRLIAWANTCLLDARGEVEYVIGTGIDVTAQRRAEEEARQRQAEVAHLHRILTAGELATVLAHELNQPLAAITSYSDASLKQLQRGELPQDRLAQNLEHISVQAQRAGRVIRELRAFLAKDESTRARTDLNAVVGRAAELVAAEARARGVQINLELADDLRAVTAADIQVEHVLVNLARNGIEAVRDSGATTGVVAIQTRSDGMATVTVRDSGPGLSPDLVEKLFEPFYTTKRDGLGMGLRISRSVIESHGGRIWAEASTAGGIFHFTLPLAT